MIYLVSNTPYNEEIPNLKHLKICEIKFNKFSIDLNEFSNLIITSKNAINSLKFNHIKPNSKIKVFAIGEASFEAASKFGFSSVYLAENAHGDEFGFEILSQIQDGKTLYLKAKESVSNLIEILKNTNLKIILAYENICTQDKIQKPKKDAVLIFTSPKNVACFVEKFGWDDSYKVISIGKTTEKFLLKYTKPHCCKIQTIKECIRVALLIV